MRPMPGGSLMSVSSSLWQWQDVARMAGAHPARPPAKDVVFGGVSIDSRTTKPGELFVALRGERHDGHDHAAAALERGAAGLLVEESRWREDRRLRGLAAAGPAVWLLAGDTLAALQGWSRAYRESLQPTAAALTGSSGKTTAKDLLAGALGVFGPACAAQASFNNAIGVPLTLLSLKPDDHYLVAELGMNRSGEIASLVRMVQPHVALITSLGRAHVGYLGHPGAVRDAKLEIIEGLAPDGTLVLPQEPPDLYAAA
ncbi:MAG: UDP-N-acetylmuramoylalanyl-D-glutamyl-2, 6-diaminopimelate--D-alanyl-D-alanine ligase, partial [Candidatus Eisenbacteria bacterium]|nr:UDP-N-acetylmuramoylalanyl-D-glutamyl-2, 6-diaminopimelate--D-alanyl-D-alanine ligase [Candidatus Eisenbacteria bacterium]